MKQRVGESNGPKIPRGFVELDETCLSLTPETSICLRECERNRVPMITFGKVLKFHSCMVVISKLWFQGEK